MGRGETGEEEGVGGYRERVYTVNREEQRRMKRRGKNEKRAKKRERAEKRREQGERRDEVKVVVLVSDGCRKEMGEGRERKEIVGKEGEERRRGREG
jgi:hypothetical protein